MDEKTVYQWFNICVDIREAQIIKPGIDHRNNLFATMDSYKDPEWDHTFRPGLDNVVIRINVDAHGDGIGKYILDSFSDTYGIPKRKIAIISISPMFKGTLTEYTNKKWKSHKYYNNIATKNHQRIN